ncbi:MAG: recombinase family protein [Anaerolineales bacterium]|nr:recombinase family protein [Anaerolineales bacterium]
MKFATYSRVSTAEQVKGYSISTQLEANQRHGLAEGWQHVADFVDEGVSGTTDQRPAFQQCIRAALAGEYQVIVVYSYDRFSRKMQDAVMYKDLLRREGVRVVSVIEPVDDTPMGFLQEGIADLFAAFYSLNLSVKIQRGLISAVEDGRWPGKPPYGYQKNGGWVEVAEAGAFIKQAFQEFASGRYTLDTWAERAYRQGVRAPQGGKLAPGDWSRIFHNKFYMGVLQWSGVEAEGRHEPLIDEMTWHLVQTVLLDNNQGKQPKQQRFYLLRGLVWSNDASSIMSGAVGKGYRYYRSRKPTPTGQRHYIPADHLESLVVSALSSVTIDPNGLTELDLDEALTLAMRVAPNIGTLYQHLETDNQRQAMLRMVVARYGFKVSGKEIVSVVVRPPFRQFDKILVELPRVEHRPTLFYLGVAA